jgi:DNA-binding transcriptional LysR family regulator
MDASTLQTLHADRLRAFLAVVQEGGFSRAARKLGQTQSSVSQAVRALEDEVGEVLLDRAGRTVQLTEAGKLVAFHAERVFEELGRLNAALSARRALTAGRLLLGTSDTLATYVLPRVFARFRARYPSVELSLDNRPSPAIAARVAARELDLGVVSLPLPHELRIAGKRASDALRIEVLAAQRDVVIVPPDHALATRKRLTLGELASETWVLLDSSTSTRALLDGRFRELGLEPRVSMEMSSVEVLKRLVELGFGVSVVPEVATRSEVQNRSLCAVELAGLGNQRKLGLVSPLSGLLSHAARAFRDVLVEELA